MGNGVVTEEPEEDAQRSRARGARRHLQPRIHAFQGKTQARNSKGKAMVPAARAAPWP